MRKVGESRWHTRPFACYDRSMKLNFSLRDLFWLVLVVGMALGWWVDRWQYERHFKQVSVNELSRAQEQYHDLRRAVSRAGCSLSWDGSGWTVTLPKR